MTAVEAYLTRVGPRTRESARFAAERIARFLGCPSARLIDWPAVTYEQALELRNRLVTGYSQNTAHKMHALFNSLVQEAQRLGCVTADHAARLRDTPPIASEDTKPGRRLARWEIDALFAQADKRQAAALACMIFGGLRKAEVARLTLDEVRADQQGGYLLTPWGKGSKRRRVYLHTEAAEHMRAWLMIRGRTIPASTPTVFGWTHANVYRIVIVLAKRARLTRVRPHDLRRTYVSACLDSKADIATIAATCGHADPRTTLKYDRRNDDARVNLAKNLRF